MNKDTYSKELTRYFNSVRDDKYKGEAESASCIGVLCTDCIFNNEVSRDCFFKEGMFNVQYMFDAFEELEKWSKEHPPKKYKVSKLEYSILEAYMDLSNCGSVKMLDFPVFNRLHELGYFKGATTDTYTRDYFENCEVEEDV